MKPIMANISSVFANESIALLTLNVDFPKSLTIAIKKSFEQK
jgi:hypothetical protein